MIPKITDIRFFLLLALPALLAALPSCDRAGRLLDAGEALLEKEQYDEAAAVLEEALFIAEDAGDELPVAKACYLLGRAYQKRNRHDEAEAHLQRALSIFRGRGDEGEAAGCLWVMGLVQQRLGNVSRVRELASQALELHESAGARAGVMNDHILLANTHLFLGDYRRAEQGYLIARELAESLDDDRGSGLACQGLGMVYVDIGDPARAVEYCRKALERFDAAGYMLGQARTNTNMGAAFLLLGDLEGATACYEKSIKIKEGIGDRLGRGFASINLGHVLALKGEPAKALDHIDLGLKINRDAGNRRGSAFALMMRGRAHDAGGRGDAAHKDLSEAIAISREMADPDLLWRSLWRRGEALDRMNRPDRALEDYVEAAAIFEGARSRLKVREYKTGYMEDKTSVYSRLIGHYIDGKAFDQVFHTIERAKARTLLDMIDRKIAFYKPDGPSQEALFRETDDRFRALKTKIRIELSRPPERRNPQLGEWNEALEKVTRRRADLLVEIEREKLEEASLEAEALAIAPFQETLPTGIVFLEYYLLPDRIIIGLVTHDRLTVKEVGIDAASLRAKVDGLLRSIGNEGDDAAGDEFSRLSSEVYDLLLAPLMDEIESLGATDLVISPHLFLHHLPFQLLKKEGRYLVEDFQVLYTPSASIFTKIRQRRITADAGPLVVTDPHSRLHFARKEAGIICASTTGSMMVEGEDEFKANCHDRGILHLAVHGIQDAANPLFSHLQMAPGGSDNGLLEVYEVFDLRLKGPLVVLSACSSGLGDITISDDTTGFTEAFLYAGAASVLSTLWDVDDESTMIFMERFYRHLARVPASKALRRTQVELLTGAGTNNPRHTHPRRWAPFVLTGDWNPPGNMFGFTTIH